MRFTLGDLQQMVPHLRVNYVLHEAVILRAEHCRLPSSCTCDTSSVSHLCTMRHGEVSLHPMPMMYPVSPQTYLRSSSVCSRCTEWLLWTPASKNSCPSLHTVVNQNRIMAVYISAAGRPILTHYIIHIRCDCTDIRLHNQKC